MANKQTNPHDGMGAGRPGWQPRADDKRESNKVRRKNDRLEALHPLTDFLLDPRVKRIVYGDDEKGVTDESQTT